MFFAKKYFLAPIFLILTSGPMLFSIANLSKAEVTSVSENTKSDMGDAGALAAQVTPRSWPLLLLLLLL